MAQAVSNSVSDPMPSADAPTPAGATGAASTVVTRAYLHDMPPQSPDLRRGEKTASPCFDTYIKTPYIIWRVACISS